MEALVNSMQCAASLPALEVRMFNQKGHKGAQRRTAGRIRCAMAAALVVIVTAIVAVGQDARVRREMREAPAQLASKSRIAPANEPAA